MKRIVIRTTSCKGSDRLSGSVLRQTDFELTIGLCAVCHRNLTCAIVIRRKALHANCLLPQQLHVSSHCRATVMSDSGVGTLNVFCSVQRRCNLVALRPSLSTCWCSTRLLASVCSRCRRHYGRELRPIVDNELCVCVIFIKGLTGIQRQRCGENLARSLIPRGLQSTCDFQRLSLPHAHRPQGFIQELRFSF